MREGALSLLLHLHCLLAFAAAISRLELFPYGEDRGDQLLQEGDDETSEVVKLTNPLLFYEAQFNLLYVGTNGIISTQDFPRETQYVDDGFPTDFPVIAPFLSDIDTSNGRGKIYYRQDNSEQIVNEAARQIQRGFPQAAFIPDNVFLVTWENVGAYEEVTRNSPSSNRLNTFQAVIAYDESDAYAVFIYPEDGLQFFGTRPKESYNVHIELPARVGFSRGESESLKREGLFYSLTNTEQSVKNLYQSSNVGVPGVWVFHIGSISELDNVIPAKFHNFPTSDHSVLQENYHTGYPEHREEDLEETLDYPELFYDNEDEYPPNEPAELAPTQFTNPAQEATLPYVPFDSPLPPYQEPRWSPFEAGELDRDEDESQVEPQVNPETIRAQFEETINLPVALDILDSDNKTDTNTDNDDDDDFSEEEVVHRRHHVPEEGYRSPGEIGLEDYVLYNPVRKETCEKNHGQCSRHAFCTDYAAGFCCHCEENYYGNGVYCLPKGAPHRVNGKVTGNIIVGQTPVDFASVDLHAYVVVNDGRAYTAISAIPEPASWSLTPLTPIGGLFGWLFALEKPGHQNGFSITGAKFVHNMEVVFYPGEEIVYITQTADGFDSENYINLKTTIQGKIPFIPETSTVQVSPYNEIYHYSGSVVTSTAYREYTVTSQSKDEQKLSYRLRQNVTYHECLYSQRLPLSAQKLNVERVFALYNKDEKVLRYAITSHIGSIHETSQESTSNPCYDGTHACDTRAQCQPATGLNYTCVCASGYQGDGRECTDVNECDVGPARCGQNAVCSNLPGSYKCECRSGYTFAADGHNCLLESLPVNPCEDGSHTCNRESSHCVSRGDGVFTCECFAGFVKSGENCIDVDECAERRCHPDATCTNTPGAFSCHCNSGYEGDGFQCRQIQNSHLQNTPCLEKRRNLHGQFGGILPPGLFVPDCDDKGQYTPLQCHGSTGHCWCVHTNGEEIAGTRTPRGGARPQCEALDSNPQNTPCLEKRRNLHGQFGGLPPPGLFVPDCDEEGHYTPLQCHGSTGYCWCVHKNGEEIAGTRTPPGGTSPQCEVLDSNPQNTSPCLEKRRNLHGQFGGLPPPGLFVPDCDEEGHYTPLQCHGSTGYCWCVHKNGEEIAGTRTPPGGTSPQCEVLGPLKTPCLETRRHLLGEAGPRGPRPGLFVPECEDEGHYAPLQCHGSTGYCWCVNQNGEEISGTRTPPGGTRPRCGIPEPTERPQTVCERWKQSLLEHYKGRPTEEQYIPQCDKYGDFSPLQCHGNSGYCWCVNKDGREIEGSRTEPGMTPACIPTVAPPTVLPTPRPDVALSTTGTFLLYAQGQQIGYLPLNGTKLHKAKAKTLLSLHGSIVVGIDYDCQQKMVYWSDVAGRTINRASLEPGAEPEVIINSGLQSTEGLAIDYLRRTIFWTDSGLDKIESSRLDGSERKILFDTELVNPRAITVDAIRGNLYWTDWNREAPKIETSFVDGSNRRILVNDNIGLPNGLTFDPFSKQICWADAGTKKLECILPNGTGRRVIQSNLNYPFSVVAYAHYFYHTDWRRDGVISINKENGQIVDEYLPEQRSHLYGITAVYPYCPTGKK
ncbi:nidogen-2 [Bombina bombina]|uniref:nidogen-2 n=1 Tax=Bombina bombina TaxID=8345 RepID=UPI00235AC196|nr:nidogen-2 [Bombina bombina]